VIAYVFWHRPAVGTEAAAYDAAQVHFHHSLAAHPPGGFVGSACLRAQLPWLGDGGAGYEDWYVLEDFAALGVLNEAAVGRGHATAHDAAARTMGDGTGSVYRLLDGFPSFAAVRLATWITPASGRADPLLEDFLVDGMAAQEAMLWRRQLALGPAPELCLLSGELSDGARDTRLAAGWSATVAPRMPLTG
jgi:hypothetical protein